MLLRSYSRCGLSAFLLFALIGAPFANSQTVQLPQELNSYQRFESGGIALDLSFTKNDQSPTTLTAGDTATIHIALTDARSREPIRGARPRAWISARDTALACEDKVRAFASGSLASRADIDLNHYLLLTLNQDKTVTFINPMVALSATKLESVVVLPAEGADWALSKDQNFLFVTMPDLAAVAVIDTVSRKITSVLSTGEGSAPKRIALQPNGRYAWLMLDGSREVAVIDTSTHALIKLISVGGGLHSVAFSNDSRRAYVTNTTDDTISVIDAINLAKLTDIKVAQTPVALAFGSAGKVLYVSGLNSEALTVINADRDEVAATISVGRGVVAVGFEPSGRFALALNQFENRAIVIDSATNSIITSGSVVEAPDQVTFTDRYAYVRGLKSEKFTLLDLAALHDGTFAPVDIQVGTQPPLAEPQSIGPSSMIAATPDGTSAMIANAPESTIYYYVEGMMAPMGTFSTYNRSPRALALLDRSLAETKPGEYSAPVRLSNAGRFDVSVLMEKPRFVACFPLNVEGEAPVGGKLGPGIRVEPAFTFDNLAAGVSTRLVFKLIDTANGEPIGAISDLRVSITQDSGRQQRRPPVRELDPGVYAVDLAFARPGLYRMSIASTLRKVLFHDLPPIPIRVGAGSLSKALP